MRDSSPLDPTSSGPGLLRTPAPRPTNLRGTKGGVRRQWANFDAFANRIEELLQQQFETPTLKRVSGTFTDRAGEKLEKWRAFKANVEWAIVGLGACWGTAPWSVYDATELEKLGVPTVTIVTEEFAGLAREIAVAEGFPSLKMLTVPHFFEELSEETVIELANDLYPAIVNGLTEGTDDHTG